MREALDHPIFFVVLMTVAVFCMASIFRWGGKALTAKFSGMFGGAQKIRRLDARAKSWGSAGVFFIRWLVAPLGPWINFASGMTQYSWFRFSLWDALGESFGAALYICLGLFFSDRVQQVGAFLGDRKSVV